MTRRDKLLKKIDLKGEGLEIGPLCWPLLKKNEANIKYVDHVSRNDLLEIYKDDKGILPELIPEVDFPLNGRSLRNTIPKGKKFDYILASHVIEHVPDMVRWLQDMASVLKTGGILSLAIPDKRYTFDIDRHTSTTGDVVGAYIDELEKPSSSTLFDYACNFRQNIDATKVWQGELYLNSKAPHRYSLSDSYNLCLENKKRYVDTHCNVFTPSSFFAIIRDLIGLGLFDYEVVTFHDTDEGQYEFLVSLRKTGSTVSAAEKIKSLPRIKARAIRELEKKVQDLSNELAMTRNELNDVYGSKSWRITSPMRNSAHIAKKIRH